MISLRGGRFCGAAESAEDIPDMVVVAFDTTISIRAFAAP